MNELEKKLKAIKEDLKHFNFISYVLLALVVIGAVLLIVGMIIKPKSDSLFYSGVGIVATVVIVNLCNVIYKHKEIDEYYKIKKEIKKRK